MSSIPVVVVGGLHGHVRAEVVRRLLAAVPYSVAVHHDLRGAAEGRVERIVLDGWGVRERTVLPIAHGCVTCTVREDVVPALDRLAGQAALLVLETWGSVEARPIVERIGRAS